MTRYLCICWFTKNGTDMFVKSCAILIKTTWCISAGFTVSVNLLVSRDGSSAAWNPTKVGSLYLVSAWSLSKGGSPICPGCQVCTEMSSQKDGRHLERKWWKEFRIHTRNLELYSLLVLPLPNQWWCTGQPVHLASSYSSIQWDNNHPALWEHRTMWKLRKNNALGKGEPPS